MSKRFIHVMAVLLLLLLVAVESGRDLKQRMAEEYEGMTFPMNTEAVEESGQEVNIENADKKWEDTILFRGGYSGVDTWMDFAGGVVMEDGYVADIPQIVQQDTQHNQIKKNGCFADIPQCIWGKWVVTEKWVNNIYGWDAKVQDEWIGTCIELLPENFGFEDQSNETVYFANVHAVEDLWEYYYEVEIYWELGIRGDYYFEFEFKVGYEPEEIFVRNFMLISENEIVIPVTRYAAYKLEKTENYDVGEADCAFVRNGHDYDICYGEWEAVNVVRTNGTLDISACMKERLVLREREDEYLVWRVLGRSNETVDRFARMIGVGENNGYLICYNLPRDCFWDQMILIDDMTAILANGDNLFFARRISDPVHDGIYDMLP